MYVVDYFFVLQMYVVDSSFFLPMYVVDSSFFLQMYVVDSSFYLHMYFVDSSYSLHTYILEIFFFLHMYIVQILLFPTHVQCRFLLPAHVPCRSLLLLTSVHWLTYVRRWLILYLHTCVVDSSIYFHMYAVVSSFYCTYLSCRFLLLPTYVRVRCTVDSSFYF